MWYFEEGYSSYKQVKIRGFRIELGEIESVLAQFESLQECCIEVSIACKHIMSFPTNMTILLLWTIILFLIRYYYFWCFVAGSRAQGW